MIRYVKQTIADLLMNRLDISLLIITKQISRAEDKCRAPTVPLCRITVHGQPAAP